MARSRVKSRKKSKDEEISKSYHSFRDALARHIVKDWKSGVVSEEQVKMMYLYLYSG